MIDVSGFGIKINIQASKTFPNGFTVTQASDDADPVDFADTPIAETAMGVNGDMISFSQPTAIPMVVAVVPASDDDANLAMLYKANRATRGSENARDIITATVTYPDGRLLTLSQGKMISGTPASGIASSSRMKTKSYTFNFEGIQESGPSA